MLLVLLVSVSLAFGQVRKIVSAKNESQITYGITHPLHEIEALSKDAYCDVYADPATHEIKHAYVKVQVTTFNSGNSNRDSHAMEVIDAISYPEAKFTSTAIVAKGDELIISGKMTFHGITRDETIIAKAVWADETLTVNGSFALSLTAYKVERPALLMVPVNDDLRFKFTEVFKLK